MNGVHSRATFSTDKTLQNVFFKRKWWCIEHPVLMSKSFNYGIWEGHSLFFFLRIFWAWWNRYKYVLNTQNTLIVKVTVLAVLNKRQHPNWMKVFVETVVPTYCDPTFASHFRMKRQTFQLKNNPLLTPETVLWSIWPYYFYCEY